MRKAVEGWPFLPIAVFESPLSFGQVRIKNWSNNHDCLARRVLAGIGGCGLVERVIVADDDGMGVLECSIRGALNVPKSLVSSSLLSTADDEGTASLFFFFAHFLLLLVGIAAALSETIE